MKKKQVVLNPNCSEQVFRLKGDLKYIKSQILLMLDVVEAEYLGEGDSDYTKRIEYKRKEIKKVKDIEELYNIYIPFTCNYETFFKPDGNDILVATCNNHEWASGGVDYIDEDSESYYSVSDHKYYDIVNKAKDWLVVKREEYDYSIKYYPLEINGNRDIRDIKLSPYSTDNVQLRFMGDDKFILYNGERKLIFSIVKNKDKLLRITKVIMVDLL